MPPSPSRAVCRNVRSPIRPSRSTASWACARESSSLLPESGGRDAARVESTGNSNGVCVKWAEYSESSWAGKCSGRMPAAVEAAQQADAGDGRTRTPGIVDAEVAVLADDSADPAATVVFRHHRQRMPVDFRFGLYPGESGPLSEGVVLVRQQVRPLESCVMCWPVSAGSRQAEHQAPNAVTPNAPTHARITATLSHPSTREVAPPRISPISCSSRSSITNATT